MTRSPRGNRITVTLFIRAASVKSRILSGKYINRTNHSIQLLKINQMNRRQRILCFGLMLLLLTGIGHAAFAQKVYKYDTVPGDPIKTRIYTLANGLTVYTTVYKDAPRIQTAIAVRTGSKNDPSDNTGLSHYLEHMMFKGTDDFGTKDYLKEKPLLDQIEYKFEIYRKTTDTLQRKRIYH